MPFQFTAISIKMRLDTADSLLASATTPSAIHSLQSPALAQATTLTGYLELSTSLFLMEIYAQISLFSYRLCISCQSTS